MDFRTFLFSLHVIRLLAILLIDCNDLVQRFHKQRCHYCVLDLSVVLHSFLYLLAIRPIKYNEVPFCFYSVLLHTCAVPVE